MNSLNRNLVFGEKVILDERYFMPEYKNVNFRVFIVEEGFGMYKDTSGSALFGHFLGSEDTCRWEGFQIDVEATKAYQKLIK